MVHTSVAIFAAISLAQCSGSPADDPQIPMSVDRQSLIAPRIILCGFDAGKLCKEILIVAILAHRNEMAMQGRFDLLIQAFGVSFRDARVDADCWQHVVQIASMLRCFAAASSIEPELKVMQFLSRTPNGYFTTPRVPLECDPLQDLEVTRRGAQAMLGRSLSQRQPVGLWYGVFCATGNVSLRSVDECVIIAGGSVTISGVVSNSIIFCGGDFSASQGVADSIVVAGGKARLAIVGNSLIVSGKESLRDDGTLIRDSVVRAKERSPFGHIHFFGPDAIGLTIRSDRQGLPIESLNDRSPLYLAGIRTGDLVESINGAPVTSAEQLNQLLRESLTRRPLDLTIRRHEKSKRFTVFGLVNYLGKTEQQSNRLQADVQK